MRAAVSRLPLRAVLALVLFAAAPALAQETACRPDRLRERGLAPAPCPPGRLVEPLRAPAPAPDRMHPWLRATLVCTAGEAITLAVLFAMPEGTTLWRERARLSNVGRAFTTPPVWDRDVWYFNYIGHPLAGATTYLLLREQGRSALESFLFSTLHSALWEYGWEVTVEQPSRQDLLLTSTTGSLLGEGVHQLTRLLRRGGLNAAERILVTLLNPQFVVFNGYAGL